MSMSNDQSEVPNVHPISDARANSTDPETSGAETDQFPVRRNVVVIMPFGSGNKEHERQWKLDFMRIKYIVENKIKVLPEGSRADADAPGIKYNVQVFREPVGNIPEDGIDTIAEADVVIALLTKMNVNVIYELAVRNLLKDEPILILDENEKEALPVYMQSAAYINYSHPNSRSMNLKIEALAADEDVEIPNWKRLDQIPSQLKDAIDRSQNDYFASEIQDALRKTERPSHPPPFLRKHVIDLDPGKVLQSWITYCPFSVIRIKWWRKASQFGYEMADMIGKPVVYTANDDYVKLFGLNLEGIPDANGTNALILDTMIERLAGYIDPSNYQKFLEDQGRLFEQIILNDGNGQATIPIQFNHKHPADQYRNQAYLPSLIGKRVVGDPKSPHIVFLAIAFIKDFDMLHSESDE